MLTVLVKLGACWPQGHAHLVSKIVSLQTSVCLCMYVSTPEAINN